MEISNWFKGFEKGIARLSQEERSAFFSEFGENCSEDGIFPLGADSFSVRCGLFFRKVRTFFFGNVFKSLPYCMFFCNFAVS